MVVSAVFALPCGRRPIEGNRKGAVVPAHREPAARRAERGIGFQKSAGNVRGEAHESGLKGRVIGGAVISPKHANFIVNQARRERQTSKR